MKFIKKCALTLAVVGVAGFGVASPASATDTSHTLTVNGAEYQSYKESGSAIHWETSDTSVTNASFAERGQTWTGNGSDNLSCPYGIHWISNKNVLTISHCLSAPDQETTTTVEDTTTIVDDETTTTISDETTTTTTQPLEVTTTTPEEVTTTQVPVSLITAVVGTDTGKNLPVTGQSSGKIALLALVFIGLGAVLVSARRKNQH